MLIKGLQKVTLIDFPGRIACTIFTGGCTFRCGFCYNSGLVLKPSQLPTLPKEDFFSFLDSRVGKLDGVCITGGEPTLHADLPDMCRMIKEKGFEVKLDTNGTNPDMVERLISEKLVDYIAMDIKASREKYSRVVGVDVDLNKLSRTISLIIDSGLEHEFRTTVVPGILEDQDLSRMGEWVKGAKRYFIQQFRATDTAIGEKYKTAKPEPKEKLEKFKALIAVHVPEVSIRG